jgi:hypothetical protein
VDPGDGTCPMCGRTLICPRCQEPRGASDECVNCGWLIREEADGPPLMVASRAGDQAAGIADGFSSGGQSPYITDKRNLSG